MPKTQLYTRHQPTTAQVGRKKRGLPIVNQTHPVKGAPHPSLKRIQKVKMVENEGSF